MPSHPSQPLSASRVRRAAVRLPVLVLLAVATLSALAACATSGTTQPPTSTGFSVDVSPAAAFVGRGAATDVLVSLTRTGGFSDDVALSVSGIPAAAGVTASFTPAVLSGSTTSATLQISATAVAGIQTFTLTVTGAAGDEVESATLALDVVHGTVAVQGRVVVPIEFLPEEMTYSQLFEVTRVWLVDPAGVPIAGTSVGSTGEYAFAEVPAGKAGYRVVAIFGSGEDAMMLENALAALHPKTGSIVANVTAETMLAAEIARVPELLSAYATELEAQFQTEAGEALAPDLFEPGDLYYPAWDYSSVADPFVEGEITTAATGEVCAWYLPLVNWGVDCKKVPDLVIYSHPRPLQPRQELFRFAGTEIAARITASDMNVYVEQVGEDTFVFSGVGGIIGNAAGNVIGNATGNVAAGGYNLIAKGGASVIGAGGYNFTADAGYVLGSGEKGVISISGRYPGFSVLVDSAPANVRVASNLIGQAGSNLIGQAGSNLIGNSSSNLQSRYGVLELSSAADSAELAAASIAAATTTPYLQPEYLSSPDSPPAVPTSYAIATLPFLSIDGVAGTTTFAGGIDDSGRVVGFSGTSECYQAFLWADNAMTNLYPQPGGPYCVKSSAVISPGGLIAGTSTDSVGSAQALYLSGSTLTPIDFEDTTITTSAAHGVNDLGDIRGSVGYATEGPYHAIFDASGTLAQTLFSGIVAINDSRQYAGNHPVMYSPNLTYLDTYSYSSPGDEAYDDLGAINVVDLNGHGQVLAEAYDDQGNSRAVIWHHGAITELAALDGAFSHIPTRINDHGDAIGYALIGTIMEYDTTPVLWTGGSVVDVGALAADAGWTIYNIGGFNNEGQITAQGYSAAQPSPVGLVLSPR